MRNTCIIIFTFLFFAMMLQSSISAQSIDLSRAVILVRNNPSSLVEKTAARVLVEEVEKRTGLQWKISTTWPEQGIVIALLSGKAEPEW